ncbi:MAG: DNA-protecting protein DprA, partial [Flavobacteriales bacterium]|nr:DNA-protecting protein DprA [Flavobacteriales bacterium]
MKKDVGPGPDVLYEIALTLIPRIGPVRVRSLVSHCGSARQVFREKKSDLMLLPDIGAGSADAIMRADVLHKAEEEIAFMERAGVRPLFFTHPEFPKRLLQCADAPAMLYIKGNPEFDRRHVVSIVGTRSATEYGRQFCEDLIADLAPLQPVIVSGLAYGIDICAHRAALQSGLSTIACLAHGLDRIYPPLHAETAKQMLETGGWVTENISGADPERESFPMRNRIIAGLADCTVVVESDKKGGSMLTAYIAESYGRSVFALPGSIHDRFSQGPHQLIRKQVATLITSANDLKDAMAWTDRKPA